MILSYYSHVLRDDKFKFSSYSHMVSPEYHPGPVVPAQNRTCLGDLSSLKAQDNFFFLFQTLFVSFIDMFAI